MKLSEAIQIANKSRVGEGRVSVYLATGFNPLHFETFLAAHGAATRSIRVIVSPYGDLLESLKAKNVKDVDEVVVLLEWPDVDPRLGYRRLGGWKENDLQDTLVSSELRLAQIANRLAEIAGIRRTILCGPTLPLPPMFQTATWQAGAAEWRLRELVAAFQKRCAENRVVVISPYEVDLASPLSDRHDVNTEFAGDSLYRMTHSDAVAGIVAKALVNVAPKKGLITDLDDTLWRGLIGEVGEDGVSFDLDSSSQGHGLYQQLLASLADAGVLVAIASKNNHDVVISALSRLKLHIDPKVIYPVEANWNAKSESVQRILEAWNIGAGDVVFVDDNAMELDEIRTRFPTITTVAFPTTDAAKILAMCRQLRELFGRAHVSSEDKQRSVTIRNIESARVARVQAATAEEYIQTLGGKLVLDFTLPPRDDRPFELVNKTNQFNLNGRRYDLAAWNRSLGRAEAVLAVGSYSDKFGDLGRITVLLGEKRERELFVNQWVLSCRAFSRQVEHTLIASLFRKYSIDVITFDVLPTERNGPLTEFMAQVLGKPGAQTFSGPVQMSRQSFKDRNWRLIEESFA